MVVMEPKETEVVPPDVVPLTLAQTKAILEGGKTLQEIVEIVAATEEARQDESPSVSSK